MSTRLIYRGALYQKRVSVTEGDRYRLLHFNEPSYTTTVEDLEATDDPSALRVLRNPDYLQVDEFTPADESWAEPWWKTPYKGPFPAATYKGINFRQSGVQQDNYLYHTTFLFYLSSIQEHGLVPGGQRNWQTYDTAGKLYFSDARGVFTWNYKLRDVAHAESDNPVEEGWIPITIRVSRKFMLSRVQEDPEGSKDSGSMAYYTGKGVPPGRLELWTGNTWSPVENEDEYALREQALYAAPREQVDGEELVLLDEMVFFPPALRP